MHLGAFFITKRIQTSSGITCKIQIWDTAGQSQFRAMAPMYYRNAAAAIVCYDVTDPQSFTVMREWLDELHRNVPAGSIVIAIAATKTDLSQTADATTLVPPNEAQDVANALGAIFVDTSAKSNSNVQVLFQRVAERVLQFRENARREGMNGTPGAIPVTPGASIDKTGMVVKNGISENRGNQIMSREGPEMDSSPRKQRGMSLHSRQSSNGNGVTDLSSEDELIEQTQAKLSMCDASGMACGMSGEDGRSCCIS